MTVLDPSPAPALESALHTYKTRHVPHIANLTGIRAIAALWVALFHFQTTEVVSSIDLGPVVAGGYLGVDVFFVLSGFILALNYLQRGSVDTSKPFDREFVLRRVARIYPLHLATFAISVVMFGVATVLGYSFVADVRNDGWTAVANVANVHGWGLFDELSWNSVSWSVSAEWFAYLLLFPVLVRYLAPRRLAVGVAVTVVLWGLFIAYTELLHGGELDGVTKDGFVRIIPEFTAGFVLCGWCCAPSVRKRWSGRRADAAAALAVALVIAVALGPLQTWFVLLPAIALLIAALFFGGPLVTRIFSHPTAVWLGERSFAIYMVHVLVQIVFNQAMRRLPVPTTLATGMAVLAAQIAVTIAVAALAYRMIEIPAQRRIVQRWSRRD